MSQQFIGIPLEKNKVLYFDKMGSYFIAVVLGILFHPLIAIALFILIFLDPIKMSSFMPTSPILYFDDSD